MYGLRVVGLSSLTARLWGALAATARSAAQRPWQLAAGLVAGATICAVVGIVINPWLTPSYRVALWYRPPGRWLGLAIAVLTVGALLGLARLRRRRLDLSVSGGKA